MNRTCLSRRALLAHAALLAASPLFAQTGDWPKGPVRFIVPGPSGGVMDRLLRIVQPSLQTALGQPVVIEYKAGANSIIGIDAVAKAAPDGQTWGIAPSSAIAINPVIVPKMPYDAEKDLAAVAQFGAAGVLLVANPSTGFKSLQDMVAYAKANPGKLSYASWGNGSTGHLVMEGIKAHYKVFMPHIPYRTTAQALTDLLGGTITVGFLDIASPIPHVQAGRLVALGASGSSRGPALPNLPILSEQGFKFEADGWLGIFAPANTPPAIVTRMNQEIGKILAVEDTKQKFLAQNMTLPPFKTAAQFATTVKADIETWQSMAKTANLKMD